jgi:predicted metal-dependent HD superfamily phosphohydrolase
VTAAALASRFAEDLEPFCRDRAVAERLLADIIARHAEPHRRYHGVAHLAALADLLDRYAAHAAPGSAARLAVWWHDAIYDPRARDNEEQSARLACTHLGEAGAPSNLIDAVAALILATRDHWSGPAMGEGDYFLDADIAILGAPPDLYDSYATGVRTEYAWATDEAFRFGRRAFLASALQRPRLFRTDAFEAAFAGPARANMQRELDRL